MTSYYYLNLRVVILEKKGCFTVEALEIMGQITASTKDEALKCLVRCIEGALAVGEPIWRDPPDKLLKIWKGATGKLVDGSFLERKILKVRGFRPDVQEARLSA